MTDNEIIKALELAREMEQEDVVIYCEDVCTLLDLINRQKAEIEKLKNTIDWTLDQQPILVERAEKYARAEAVKEFAERLCEGRVSNDPVVIAVKVELETVGE